MIVALAILAMGILSADPAGSKVFTLKFDFTDAASVDSVDGFILYETTNVALPLDQWTPRLALSKTNWNLPASGNQFRITNAPGNYFWALAATNTTWGVTLSSSFSNLVTNRPVAVAGTGLGVAGVATP